MLSLNELNKKYIEESLLLSLESDYLDKDEAEIKSKRVSYITDQEIEMVVEFQESSANFKLLRKDVLKVVFNNASLLSLSIYGE